ncbi:MAG: 3-deoxy-D-manno-octulosonic acid transferase, partial [Pseudomonas sp.]|nr:3-deoxy-D-manno-octulosonic acid transferase [Pseudomonas sp.]
AALGVPVLSGPHLFNFTEIASLLRDAGALQEVADAPALAAALNDLLQQPTHAETMAAAGLAVVKANQGALQRLLAGVQGLLQH